MSSFPKISQLMESGVKEGVFPGAVLLAARGDEILFHQAFGHSSIFPEKQILQKDTIFDLASLTKPLATTLGIMILVQKGLLSLDQSLESLAKRFYYPEQKAITLRQLLSHSAGFPAYQPYYSDLVRQPGNKKAILRDWVIKEPLIYPPGSQTLYSDLGFIVLDWIFEEAAGERMDPWIRKTIYDPLGLVRTGFRPLVSSGVSEPNLYAATEDCPWRKKILRGEVHDENAYAVGGVSGQAGLFGTAFEIFNLLQALKKAYDRPNRPGLFDGSLVRIFWEREDRPRGTTRTLGFDTPAETGSSAGRYFSPKSVGHLGFTGTSFWLDLEKDLLVILLSNRIHPTRANEKIKSFRPLIHDLVFQEMTAE
ncbi:MAG: beta-lactamase family protein [Deltaproteobacteria bacterium]|nr:beta-lactamase family protein [Deltaproteobacteria bacterium]